MVFYRQQHNAMPPTKHAIPYDESTRIILIDTVRISPMVNSGGGLVCLGCIQADLNDKSYTDTNDRKLLIFFEYFTNMQI